MDGKTQRRIALTELRIINGDLPPAIVTFMPGLNLIFGSSNTGKSYIFEAIDFMLGATGARGVKAGLRPLSESRGYTTAELLIDAPDGLPVTLRRALRGGQIKVAEYGNGRYGPYTAARILSSKHSEDPDASLSAYLLRMIGLEGRKVRKNALGDKVSLSFRHVCHLALINETRIIDQASPLFTEQRTAHPAEENVFAYLLTGQDDSEIIARENPKQRKARLIGEESALEAVLTENRCELADTSVGSPDIAEQIIRLDAAIEEATREVGSTQVAITQLESRRGVFFEERTTTQSRLGFLEEQLKRLRLLADYYQTDLLRLQAVIEASRAFDELPEGTCPLCRQPYPTLGGSGSRHREFEAACSREMEKIEALQRDLEAAVGDYSQEESDLQNRLREVITQMDEIDAQLEHVLIPHARHNQAELRQLVQARTAATREATLRNTVRGLEERLLRVRHARAEKLQSEAFPKRVTTGTATELCKVIEGILRDWKYPRLETVAFDTESADLVINGQDRASQGKGYRALTYAAFTIGLMKFCRSNDIPHPGFVILDTPLNPLKGPIPTSPAEQLAGQLTDEIKLAFYEYLVGDSSGDQFVIIENQDPPQSILDGAHYYQFTMNSELGRYGFFPSSETTPTLISPFRPE